MSWTEIVRDVFLVKAKTELLLRGQGARPEDLLRDLSEESGICLEVLEGWWNGGPPEFSDVGVSPPDICILCKERPVYIRSDTKRPYGAESRVFGLCGSCNARQRRILKKDALADEGGVLCFCPKCFHGFYIDKNRVRRRR